MRCPPPPHQFHDWPMSKLARHASPFSAFAALQQASALIWILVTFSPASRRGGYSDRSQESASLQCFRRQCRKINLYLEFPVLNSFFSWGDCLKVRCMPVFVDRAWRETDFLFGSSQDLSIHLILVVVKTLVRTIRCQEARSLRLGGPDVVKFISGAFLLCFCVIDVRYV